MGRNRLPRAARSATDTGQIESSWGKSALTAPILPRPSLAPDGRHAWWRLAASLALSTIGGVGLWSAVIVLPTIEAEFAVGRGGASIPYTATMVGFAVGGVLM